MTYQPRTYRAQHRPDGLISFQITRQQTDLYVAATSDCRAAAGLFLVEIRKMLEDYIQKHPDFAPSMVPLNAHPDAAAWIANMCHAAEICQVGPMAAVAGAIAQELGRRLTGGGAGGAKAPCNANQGACTVGQTAQGADSPCAAQATRGEDSPGAGQTTQGAESACAGQVTRVADPLGAVQIAPDAKPFCADPTAQGVCAPCDTPKTQWESTPCGEASPQSQAQSAPAPCHEVIIENGGDLYLRLAAPRHVGLYAGPENPFTRRIALEIPAGEWGLCTSAGTHGHSISYGKADAAVVLSPCAALADACATALGNRIQSTDDLQVAVEWAIGRPGITGALAIKDDRLAMAGAMKVVSVADDG